MRRDLPGDKHVIADMHCDTLGRITGEVSSFWEGISMGHLDLPRMKEAGVLCQFFAVCVNQKTRYEGAFQRAMDIFSSFHRGICSKGKDIKVVTDYGTLKAGLESGKIAAILSVEGGETLEGSLDNLKRLYDIGVRCLTLTWNWRNQLGDGVGVDGDPQGLTPFGRDVVRYMNELGMVVDVSHLAEPGFWECIQLSKGPIIASHSNAWALAPHRRNLRDDQIRAIAEKGGVIGINFYPPFLCEGQAELSDVLRHIKHISNVGGIDVVALGSDFDGVDELPHGLRDVTELANLVHGLIREGYTDEEVEKILMGNVIRVLSEIL